MRTIMVLFQTILLSCIQHSYSQITFPRTTGSPAIQINSSSLNYIGILFDSADTFNWYGAQDYCQYYFNTSLATVQSSTDWNEIYDLAVQMNDAPLPQGDGGYVWIGYSANSNGNLVWAPCHNINSNCLYDPCEANCDVYADDWPNKAREATFSADLCGYIERDGTTKNWFDGNCDLDGKDFICNSPYGKYKTDISCDDNGDKDIEYTTEELMDIQCGSFLPRVTDYPILQFNSSSLNYIGIVSDSADELGWYYAQAWCHLQFNTSLATVQSKQDWSEIYDLAAVIDGIGGAQADGLYLWIGFKSNSDKNLVWAPCHDGIYDNCTYDPCEANCDAYADDWVNKDRESSFGADTCGYIQRGSTVKQWYDTSCDGEKDFICNSPYGKYKHDILCINNGLLDNEYTEEPGWSISCDNPTVSPTIHPSINPTLQPTPSPTNIGETKNPTKTPTNYPTRQPTTPTNNPTNTPSIIPTYYPTYDPSNYPSAIPTMIPSNHPTSKPTNIPTQAPYISSVIVDTTSATQSVSSVAMDDNNDTIILLDEIVIILLSVLIISIICAVICCLLYYYRKRRQTPKNSDQDMEEMARVTSVSVEEDKPGLLNVDIDSVKSFESLLVNDINKHAVTEFYCRAIGDYNGTEKDQLRLNNGGIYIIVRTTKSGWWYAIDENANDGWVPSNYLKKCDDNQQNELKEQHKLQIVNGDDKSEYTYKTMGDIAILQMYPIVPPVSNVSVKTHGEMEDDDDEDDDDDDDGNTTHGTVQGVPMYT